MAQDSSPLNINVGFIVHEYAGFSHEVEFDFPEFKFSPDLKLVNGSGNARFTRTQQGLLVEVQFAGTVHGECARCLDDADILVATKFNELYAFDSRSITESELLVPDNHIIELGPLVREYLVLDMPINPLCKQDCLGLCADCGKNLNDSPHTHDEASVDPRFSALQDLLEEDDN